MRRLRKASLGPAVLLATATASAQVTLDVPGTYATIGDALKVAVTGDTVLVQPGVYPEFDLSFLGRDLVVRSVGGPEVTVIDAQQLGRLFVFENGESPAALLEGFTLQNGRAPSGLDAFSPQPGGDAEHGGALLIDQSSPTIRDCTFRWNAAGDGGRGWDGLDGADGTFGDLDGEPGQPGLPGGAGGDGGAVFVFAGAPRIDGCRFLSNTAGRGGAGGKGGDGGDGDYQWPFEGDGGDGAPGGPGLQGGHGGALASDGGSALVRSCLFVDNHAGQGGSGGAGGLGGDGDQQGWSAPPGPSGIAGWGGALALFDAGSEVNGCTILDGTASTGGGIYTYGAFVYNSILRGSLPNQLAGGPGVGHSNVEGGYAGVGNLDVDPLFHEVSSGDYRLSAGSPCIDAGDQLLGVPWVFDLAGLARVFGGQTDMGAHEYAVPYPGTFEDLVLTVTVGGVGSSGDWEHAVTAGDLVTLGFDSPGLTLVWSKPLFGLQAYATGSVLPSPPTLPGVHLAGSYPGLSLLDLGGGPLGPLLLPPGGLTFGVVVPPGLVGTTVRCQALVISPLAKNGIYATTDAHELVIQ